MPDKLFTGKKKNKQRMNGWTEAVNEWACHWDRSEGQDWHLESPWGGGVSAKSVPPRQSALRHILSNEWVRDRQEKKNEHPARQMMLGQLHPSPHLSGETLWAHFTACWSAAEGSDWHLRAQHLREDWHSGRQVQMSPAKGQSTWQPGWGHSDG